tara:strand:+ start:280 stop:567 length:288 start_codon:yes stop_codon:yes gene_type:complete
MKVMRTVELVKGDMDVAFDLELHKNGYKLTLDKSTRRSIINIANKCSGEGILQILSDHLNKYLNEGWVIESDSKDVNYLNIGTVSCPLDYYSDTD